MLKRYLLFPALLGSLAASTHAQDFVFPSPSANKPDDSPVERMVITGSNVSPYSAEAAVSATKVDTPLIDTPQTITVVPRQLLDDRAVLSLNEALNNVAGVNTGGTYRDYDIYSIRGFFGTGFTYLDGLAVDRQTNFQEETFGLDRVEVIQGPASVLYGQNPPGGLVNLISKTPQKSNFTDLMTGGGSFGLAEVGVDTNGVLNQSGSIYGRVNVLYREWGTFTEHVDPSERVFFAPSLTIELTKNTRLTLLGQYYHNWTNLGFPLPAAGTVLPNINGDLSIRKNVGEPDTFPSENNIWRTQLGYQFEHRFNDVFTLRQNTRAAFHKVYFQGVYPGELQNDERTLTRNAYNSHEYYTTLGVDTSLVANFNTGPNVKHTALLGVDFYYLHDILEGGFASIGPIDIFKPVYGARAGDISLYLNQLTDTTQTGLYFQEQVKLFDRLSLVGGGREDWVSVDVTNRLGNSKSNASPSAFSPRAGIVYEVLPKKVSAYFSYSKSFQSNPGFLDLSGNQVAPEEGEQYEVGAKADLFDGKLSTTLAFYQIYRTNVPTADPVNPGTYLVTGEERHRGIDLNTTASPIKGWDILAGYAFIDARVTEDSSGLTGKRPLDVPENTFTLFTRYTLQDGPLRGLGLGVGYRYQTRMEGDAANTFSLPSFGVLDLALYYQRGPFRAQFNVINATDERYANGSYNNVYVQQGDPINVRGSVTWHF